MTRHGQRRGTVLLAVLIVVMLAILIAGSIAVRAEGGLATRAAASDRAALRALAWSGVQGVMAELDAQRGGIMDGEQPALTAEWTLFEEGGTRGVVRLVPIDGEYAVSELAKVDVNAATEAMLAKAPGFDESTAKAVRAARGSKGFDSPEGLLKVAGIDDARYYGGDDAARDATREPGAVEKPPLARVATVFAFDPCTQAGIGKGAAAWEHAGQQRVHVSVGWNIDVEKELSERLSPEAVAGAKAVLKARNLKRPGEMVAEMRRAGVGAQAWAEVLDLFTPTDDLYLRGRVDLTRAPAGVLECVPGITPEAAAGIVERRERLSAEKRRLVTWPVTEGVMTPEAFEQAADWLTTRSLVWRVRIAATLEPKVETDGSSAGTTEVKTPPTQGPRLEWEAVIDLCGARPRVAYLRDITHLGAAIQDSASERADNDLLAPRAGESPTVEPPAPPGTGAEKTREFRPDELGMKPTRREDDRSRRAAPPPAKAPAAKDEPAVGKRTNLIDRRTGRWKGQGGGT